MMTARLAMLIAAAGLAMGVAAGQSRGLAERLMAKAGTPPAERGGERVVSGDAVVAATVDGRPIHLRIDPGQPGLVILAPAVRDALGFRASGLFGLGVCYGIGRQTACGGTHLARFGWGNDRPEKRRVGWIARDYRPPADGTVGPAGLPERVVRFVLRAPRAGERTIMVPMHGGTGLFGSWFPIDGLATIGGTPIHVRFDPYHPRSLATASAAVALAAAQQGVMTSETGRQEIAFGIERPYRVMTLGRPLLLGGLSLDRVGVRVTDGDIAGRIAEDGAKPAADDPDEVVVTASRKKPRPGILILGADALARCSSIVFDKTARHIGLTCG